MPSNPPAHSTPSSPHDAAHELGLLLHELTVVNTLLGKYVLHYLDEDAGRRPPIPVTEEHTLADRVVAAGERIRSQANGRADNPHP